MVVPASLLVVGRWLLALATPAAALALTLALGPLLDQVPSAPFVAAVVVVAWAAGFRPALLATALGALALDYFFLPPLHTFASTLPECVWLIVFGTVCVCTAWVVSTRAAVQSRLAASQQQLRLVTDAAPVLIYYVDAARRYRFANRPYAERQGYAVEDIVGKRVDEVIGAERYAGIERHLTTALA
ncbi:MAG TPA: DUF4118 domain-containing protein, partial [Candidatus Limnocylindrales bacterium]